LLRQLEVRTWAPRSHLATIAGLSAEEWIDEQTVDLVGRFKRDPD
jgi:hypothetical protein